MADSKEETTREDGYQIDKHSLTKAIIAEVRHILLSSKK